MSKRTFYIYIHTHALQTYFIKYKIIIFIHTHGGFFLKAHTTSIYIYAYTCMRYKHTSLHKIYDTNRNQL